MKMLLTCFSTALSLRNSRLGDRGVRAALGHEAQHLALARGEPLERVAAAGTGEDLRDHLGIEGRPALADAADGRDELGDVGDPVLQQVADAARVAREQVGRVPLLDVLREHEDADLRPPRRGSRSRRGGPRR